MIFRRYLFICKTNLFSLFETLNLDENKYMINIILCFAFCKYSWLVLVFWCTYCTFSISTIFVSHYENNKKSLSSSENISWNQFTFHFVSKWVDFTELLWELNSAIFKFHHCCPYQNPLDWISWKTFAKAFWFPPLKK